MKHQYKSNLNMIKVSNIFNPYFSIDFFLIFEEFSKAFGMVLAVTVRPRGADDDQDHRASCDDPCPCL